MLEADHEEQFRIRFKDAHREEKHDDAEDVDSEEEKFHHHRHDVGRHDECYSRIAFFKQSIPIKRLIEKSLS